MDGTLLWSAGLAGIAVVAITWLAGRLGGTLGGLLATAPITSSAALIFLSLDAGNAFVGHQALAGGQSLFAALVAMPAYFYSLKLTRGAWLPLRLGLALTTFVLTFTAGTLAITAATPAAWAAIWMPASLAFAAVLGVTFLRAELPAMKQRAPKMGLTVREGALRFAAGAGVVLLVGWLRVVTPGLSAAWAVFPGTFLVTLWILGLERGAAFSAKASQGGVLGVPPLAAYLLTLWAVLPMHDGTAWTFLAQAPAWAAYFAVLVPLAKWREAAPAPAAVAA